MPINRFKAITFRISYGFPSQLLTCWGRLLNTESGTSFCQTQHTSFLPNCDHHIDSSWRFLCKMQNIQNFILELALTFSLSSFSFLLFLSVWKKPFLHHMLFSRKWHLTFSFPGPKMVERVLGEKLTSKGRYITRYCKSIFSHTSL